MKVVVAFVVIVTLVVGTGSVLAAHERRQGEADDEAGSSVALLALSWVEGRLLVRHPLFWVPLVLSLGVMMLTFGWWWSSDVVGPQTDAVWLMAITAAVSILGLLLASNRTALRTRRDGTRELVASLPTAPRTRTAALLIGGWLPAFTLLAVTATAVVAYVVGRPDLDRFRWEPVQLGVVVVVAYGAVVVGVLTARWLPVAVSGLVGVVAVMLLNNTFDHLHPQWRWLHVLPEPDFGGIFDLREDRWHLAYLLALVAFAVGIALARHGLRPGVVALLVIGGLGTVVTGWVQTRPPSLAEVAQRVAMLEEPAAHQTCETHGAVRYCAYRQLGHFIPEWRAAAEGVLAAAPDAAKPAALDVVQRPYVHTVDELLPEVRAALDRDAAFGADGDVHPAMQLHLDHRHTEVAYMTAASLVGLPPSVAVGNVACVASGQARGMVALWLTAAATPEAATSLRERAERLTPNAVVVLDTVPEWGTGDYEAVVGSGAAGGDLLGALALHELPVAAVQAALAAHWDDVLDPATPSAAVFGWLARPVPEAVVATEKVVPDQSDGVFRRTCA